MEVDEEIERGGIRETTFSTKRHERLIPGVIFAPAVPRQGPLILLGHGGSGSVHDQFLVALAHRLVREEGCVCVAIDGPVHGRRRGERSDNGDLVLLEFSQIWAGDPTMTDEMVADWRVVLEEVIEALALDDRPVGYWGLSMGTILGLPLVAAEPRISAAVLGLCGLTGPTRDRLGADAAAITCPVFFVLQLDDALFDEQSARALFDVLGSEDKELHANPGGHGAVPIDTFVASADFLVDRLRR
jgi:dienelactone hydrolase